MSEEIKILNSLGFANVTQLSLHYVALQQENEKLKKQSQIDNELLRTALISNSELVEQLDLYKSVLDEIREYINKNECNYIYLDCKLYETEIYKHLLQILDKVGSNE